MMVVDLAARSTRLSFSAGIRRPADRSARIIVDCADTRYRVQARRITPRHSMIASADPASAPPDPTGDAQPAPASAPIEPPATDPADADPAAASGSPGSASAPPARAKSAKSAQPPPLPESLAPLNFDNIELDAVLSDWVDAIKDNGVEAVAILGPDPFASVEQRLVLAVHPPHLLPAAQSLAASHDFGAPWRSAESPMANWQDIARSAYASSSRWRRLWLGHGFQSVARVEFALPAQRALECFMFSSREWNGRSEASALVWSALNVWPLLRRTLAEARGLLTAREVECLRLAFDGLTAAQTAVRLGCTERTVNFHITNAMYKLRCDNKLAAVQRALWLGAI
ncbi:MAG: helix-turn-helix transcriptional regulator [Burkholderiales bacterium]|jgi:DNA-binding CsgD family transcriptional regulator|nr:helix-turn-helix transcriptional regulator [Burkholderiales bacterium]